MAKPIKKKPDVADKVASDEKSKTEYHEHMASYESKAEKKEKQKAANHLNALAAHKKLDKFKK